MRSTPRLSSLRAALLLAALALPLAGCLDEGAAPLAPSAEPAASPSLAATDAELAASQVRLQGPGAQIW